MIVKRLYLNMENWLVSRGSYQLGYIAENQVTLLQIATEIDSSCTYHLEHEINGESYILYLEQGDGVLTATIPNTMLTSVGNANWQIVGIWPDNSVKKSNVFNVYISNSINAENEVPASEITAFTEALADLAGNMSEVAAYAESASASASNASTSASNASASAESANASAESASSSAENASTSAERASASAESASNSATNASASASEASISASEASTSAENAATSATNASASANEANTHASNASASATTATEQAGLASSSATLAQTYAGNASTSEQNCATYAGNASASAEEAREYVESLDNWTTVEFTLADFTYDENSGVTYLPIEAPSGYKFEEIRGYIVFNKTEADSNNYVITVEPAIERFDQSVNLTRAIYSITQGPNTFGYIGHVDFNYNHDLRYILCLGANGPYTSSVNAQTAASYSPVSKGKSIFYDTIYSANRIVLKTNVPHANISEFYGKLQYRVVPAA